MGLMEDNLGNTDLFYLLASLNNNFIHEEFTSEIFLKDAAILVVRVPGHHFSPPSLNQGYGSIPRIILMFFLCKIF